MHERAYAVVRGVRPYVCPSVRLSVTFVYSVETNKHIFKKFVTIGYIHTIQVFP